MKASIWIGFDPREAVAFAVARYSLSRHLLRSIPIHGLVLSDLQEAGLYNRPIECRSSAADRPLMWDIISDAPMSTQHANARFLVPHVAKHGWALFMDGDILVREDISQLFDLDPEKAIYCVHHNYDPVWKEKKDGQIQTRYSRKNWSSFMLFNCDHPANKRLTVELINTVPGRDLHRFCWLEDDEIGELPPKYNFLVGHSNGPIEPACVHFTTGLPDVPGYENVLYADEWREELRRWAL